MMNILEEAVIFSTIMHQGKVRKFGGRPYILHPMEVAQILSTMTDDDEVVTAGILHDIVEDTDGTLEEIEKRFGKRVAHLVASESENEYPGVDRAASWQRRKEDSLLVLRNSEDVGVKMLWLADKLSNIRSLAGAYSERGEEVWSELHQSDPAMQRWYYKSVAEILELDLNRTGAFKEFIKHVNFIWPGTFDSEKARFRKYREVSIDGCKLLGRGAKGDVYRYDEELVIKVFNKKNLYQDVEREIAQSREAFILGFPTAISFGIVAVGDRYGAMYELIDSDTISNCIARDAEQVGTYAQVMAELARTIHGIEAPPEDIFPEVKERLREYIRGGVGCEDERLAERCYELIDGIPDVNTFVHGDFHSNNVFMTSWEPLLIDMDRISRGHPIAEIADLYYFYVLLGEDDPSVVEGFMGFSYETAKSFYDEFLKSYLGTDDADKLREVTEKASVLCCSRLIRMIRKKGALSAVDRERIERCLARIAGLLEKVDSLAF